MIVVSPMDGSFARGPFDVPLWRIATPGTGAIHFIDEAKRLAQTAFIPLAFARLDL